MTTLDLQPGMPGSDQVPTSFRSTVMAGVAVLGVTFGGFGLWAAVAPLSSAAIAPGVVAVAGSNKQVQHLEGGVVKALYVKEGDRVAAGDVLIELDPTRAAAQVDMVRGQLDATEALVARLIAERDARTEIPFPETLVARAGNSDVDAILNGQRMLFEARRNALDGQVTILQQRKAQAQEQITGLTAQKDSHDRQIALIEDELKGLKDLNQKGYAPKTRILALEREASRLIGERGQHLGDIARIQQTIGETDLQIIQVRRTFEEEVATQLREAQTQQFDLRERLRAAEDVLLRTTIRAPSAGVVVGLKVHTIGGVIPPGEVLAQIVPDEDELVIEAQLQVTDIDSVRPGMPADVKFSAFKQNITPTIHGKVSTISADRLTDPRTGAPYYSVRITVPDEEIDRLGGAQIVPGMPADAFIQTGEHTALDYLVRPLVQVIERSFREE